MWDPAVLMGDFHFQVIDWPAVLTHWYSNQAFCNIESNESTAEKSFLRRKQELHSVFDWNQLTFCSDRDGSR